MASHIEHRRPARVQPRDPHRLLWLAGAVAAVAAALALAVSLGGGGGGRAPAGSSSAVARVDALLAGIPQSGVALGSASAPVTITEYSDLVCPACDAFAVGSETQLIRTDVRGGAVRLVARGLETASGIANGAEYVTSQTAIRSAGLQGRAWNYLLLAYEEQPTEVGGVSAEQAPYMTQAYLRRLAAQIPHLNLVAWQAGLGNPALEAAVTADAQAANAARVDSTPTLLISGSAGTVQLTGAPTFAQLEAAISRAG